MKFHFKKSQFEDDQLCALYKNLYQSRNTQISHRIFTNSQSLFPLMVRTFFCHKLTNISYNILSVGIIA